MATKANENDITSGPTPDPNQIDIIDKIVTSIEKKNNINVSGNAGTSKTFILKHVVARLRQQKKRVLVLAHTGQAANAVHGITTAKFLHGMGGFQSPLKQFFSSVKRILDKTGKAKWWSTRGCDVCVIEEYSQIDPEHFARIMHIFRTACTNRVPIVLFGDPLQCPPIPIPFYSPNFRENVLGINDRLSLEGICEEKLAALHSEVKRQQKNRNKCSNPSTNPVKYLFQIPLYTSLEFRCLILDKPYRQSKDLEFYSVLNRLRVGRLTNDDLKYLCSRQGHLESPPVCLCTTKKDVIRSSEHSYVQASKEQGFKDLTVGMYTGEATITRAICEGKYVHAFTNVDIDKFGNRPKYRQLESEVTRDGFCSETKVYVGQRVMLNQNVDLKQGLFNGRVGIVLSLDRPDPHPDGYVNPPLLPTIRWDPISDNTPPLEQILYMVVHVRKDNFKDGSDTCNSEIVYHLPIVDCSALTWNRAQGKTLGSVHVNLPYRSPSNPLLGWMPENGPYVSLSRARSIDTLSLSRIQSPYENFPITTHCLNNTVAKDALQFWEKLLESPFNLHVFEPKTKKIRQMTLNEY